MRVCSAPDCRLPLAGRTHFREVAHCWVELRAQGGADSIRAAKYTGRAMCALCLLDVVGPTEQTPRPRASACAQCGTASLPLFAEVTHCYVLARAGAGAHAPTRIVYSGLVSCRRCAFEVEKGEQLELFPGSGKP